MANRAKGCSGRGGNAHGKEYEARRHGAGGGKGKRRRASASRVEKAHETVERRVGKAAIAKALNEWEDLPTLQDAINQTAALIKAEGE